MTPTEMTEQFPPSNEDVALIPCLQLKEAFFIDFGNGNGFGLQVGDWLAIREQDGKKQLCGLTQDYFHNYFTVVCECDKNESALLANENGFPGFASSSWVYITEIDTAYIC